jgi:hypothetical protein
MIALSLAKKISFGSKKKLRLNLELKSLNRKRPRKYFVFSSASILASNVIESNRGK